MAPHTKHHTTRYAWSLVQYSLLSHHAALRNFLEFPFVGIPLLIKTYVDFVLVLFKLFTYLVTKMQSL